MSAAAPARRYGDPNNTLYVEDLELSRTHVIGLLQEANFSNVTAPDSLNECARLVMDQTFKRAVIDYDLQDWVGIDKTNPIPIGGRMVSNGVQLAEELRARDTSIQLALFSAYSDDLRQALSKSPLGRSADVVVLDPDESEDPAQHITGFMERNHELELVMRALHKFEDLPEEIACFLATRLFESTTRAQDVWVCGDRTWLVGVNEPPLHEDDLTVHPDVTRYKRLVLELDRAELRIGAIVDGETNERLCLASPFENDFTQDHSLLHQFLLAKAFAHHCARDRGSESNAVKIIQTFDPNAVLEFQKSMFKLVAGDIDSGTKEEVYARLEPLCAAGLPRILDVYECWIDSKSDGFVYVKARSLSPERVVRQEVFAEAFLLESYVNNGPFEMTIWNPGVKGGAFNLQPI